MCCPVFNCCGTEIIWQPAALFLDGEVPGHVKHSSCGADTEAELDEKAVVVTAVLVFLERSGDVEDNVGLGSAADSSTKGSLFKLLDGVERQESLKPMMGVVESRNSLLIIWDEVIRSRGAGTSGRELAPRNRQHVFGSCWRCVSAVEGDQILLRMKDSPSLQMRRRRSLC